jgi:predicted Zn-dependent protease
MFSSFISPKRHALALFLLLIFLSGARSASAQDQLLDLLADELNREMQALKTQETPPYFISYAVSDVHNTSINASFGTLTRSDASDDRLLSVMVRTGDYGLDNTRQLRGDPFSAFTFRMSGFVRMPREPNPEAIRAALWQETNTEYRNAVERYLKVKANVAVKVAAEDTSADFSQEPNPAAYYEPPVDAKALLGNPAVWENKVKKYSALFLKNKDIYGGQASFSFTVERKNLVTTEGAKLAQNLIYSRLFVTGFIKADDGMELPLYLSYFAFKPSDLPKDEVILADAEGMIKKLATLRHAPVVDPYTGPAILSGRAAGVFFHEIFGHRIEGHRQKSEDEGQTFKKKIAEKILPESFSVVFDPTIKNYANRELVGFYKYDDEGVPARRVSIVENGVFKGFLMSRSPVEGFPNSNGHGRAQAGFRPVARQSNLIVDAQSPVPEAELRRILIEECKKQGKPFGLLFKDIQGGFTFTGRTIPNAFNVLPTEVYRIYTDGRPDELVRGVDLVGTPLVMFSNISQAGDKFDLFNGVCGAESGGVPVSAVSPALLVTQVEVQKKTKSQERPPLLPRPDTEPTM